MVGLDINDNARKRALLLHYAGEEVYDVFGTLPNRGDNDAYDEAKAALNKHFIPKRNTEHDVMEFRSLMQETTETFADDEFM